MNQKAQEPRYVLAPSLSIAEYGGRYYELDTRLTKQSLLQFPTKPIEKHLYDVLQALLLVHLRKQGRTRAQIERVLEEKSLARDWAGRLVELGYLEREAEAADDPAEQVLARLIHKFGGQSESDLERGHAAFDAEMERRTFTNRAFFNLPAETDPRTCQVGIAGVPASSLAENAGCSLAPTHLRAMTAIYSWIEIHKKGFYSDGLTRDGKPVILCRDVMVKDYGDVAVEGQTIAGLFHEIRGLVRSMYGEDGIFPLFVGGDHAITFPIAHALLETVPDLHLVHLDAHNDLFYRDKASYHHAGPITSLLQYSGIKKVMSFGMRSFLDDRVQNMEAWRNHPLWSERVDLYSLMHVKQLLADPDRLRRVLRTCRGEPVYLTLDLDVLTANAAGFQLSTPMGIGLEWYELLYFIDVAFDELDIIGCDVVEYNPMNGTARKETIFFLRTLLLYLIDRLAAKHRVLGPRVREAFKVPPRDG